MCWRSYNLKSQCLVPNTGVWCSPRLATMPPATSNYRGDPREANATRVAALCVSNIKFVLFWTFLCIQTFSAFSFYICNYFNLYLTYFLYLSDDIYCILSRIITQNKSLALTFYYHNEIKVVFYLWKIFLNLK